MANNFTPGGVFNNAANASGNAPSTPAGQYVRDWTYDSNTGIVTVTFGDGTVTTFTIEAGGDTPVTGGNPVVSVTFNNPILQIALESGTSFDVDISSVNTDTNNYVDGGSLSGTDLTLTREGLDDLSIDLSTLVTNANIVTNGNTYTNTRNDVTLTIENNTVTLTAADIPPVNPQPPGNPPDFNAIDGGVVDFDAPNENGGSITNTNITEISATDSEGNAVSIATPTPDGDGSFQITVPAGTDEVDVDVTYTGTNSDGGTYTEDVMLEADGFLPYYTFSTAPTLTTNASIPATADESNAEIGSGTSFSITTTNTERRWLAAAQSGLTFMNQGFPVFALSLIHISEPTRPY